MVRVFTYLVNHFTCFHFNLIFIPLPYIEISVTFFSKFHKPNLSKCLILYLYFITILLLFKQPINSSFLVKYPHFPLLLQYIIGTHATKLGTRTRTFSFQILDCVSTLDHRSTNNFGVDVVTLIISNYFFWEWNNINHNKIFKNFKSLMILNQLTLNTCFTECRTSTIYWLNSIGAGIVTFHWETTSFHQDCIVHALQNFHIKIYAIQTLYSIVGKKQLGVQIVS